jgi:protein O-mannosyl-transferase
MNHPPTTNVEPLTSRPRSAPSGIPRGVLCLGTILLGAALFLVYYSATDGPLICDDFATIIDNPSIRQLWPLLGSGKGNCPLNPSKATPVHGRPLVNLTLAVNYYFGGIDPFGYRIVHIVVHILSAMLLWAIIARTLRLDYFQGRFDRVAVPLSYAAALVWALHPLNTETIVYVTQRTELLMGMFYLATLYCSIRFWTTARPALRATFLAAATLACLSGMLCKEMMASAPAMVLLFEYIFVTGSLRRALGRSWPLYVGLALAWVPVLALNIDGPRTPGAGFGMGATGYEWWFTQAQVLFLYLKLAIWPWPLVIHYEIPYLKTVAEAWPWLLTTGLLALGTLVLLWRRSAAGFVAVWVFAVLSPTLLIPLVGETVAERRMYVPLAAIVPLLIVGGYVVLLRVWRFVVQRAGRELSDAGAIAVFSVATIALAIGFGCISSHRLLVYRDRLSLWQDAVVHQPHDPLVQLNLGTLLAEAGRFKESLRHFEEAVRLAPEPTKGNTVWYAELMQYRANYNLARALEGLLRYQDAIEHYRVTLKLRPDDSASHYNLARLLENTGHTLQAIEHYRQALAVQPDFSAAHTNLGVLLLSAGNTQEAIKNFEAALRGLENLTNYTNLAMAYSLANRVAEAIPLTEKALVLARSQSATSLAEELEATLADFRAQRPTPSGAADQ